MWVSLILTSLALVGCYDERVIATQDTASLNVDPSQAWVLQMDSVQKRALYDSEPGWLALYRQDAGAALEAFGRASQRLDEMEASEAARTRRGLARAHLVLAAVLRQGALTSAHAYVKSFSDGPREETDPVEVDYLLGVSHGLLGDCSASRKALAALPEGTVVDGKARAWAAWADDKTGSCPRTPGPTEAVGVFPGDPGVIEPGLRPEIGSDAVKTHYGFAHQGEGSGSVLKASDPTSLLVMAERDAVNRAVAGP